MIITILLTICLMVFLILIVVMLEYKSELDRLCKLVEDLRIDVDVLNGAKRAIR